MNIREATDDDVDALAALVEADFDAERLVHERTVLVAVAETDDDAGAEGADHGAGVDDGEGTGVDEDDGEGTGVDEDDGEGTGVDEDDGEGTGVDEDDGEGTGVDEGGDTTGGDGNEGELLGFVSYDTWGGTVHLSTLVGDPEGVDALLEEPRRLADAEDMPVEIVVPEHDERLRSVVTEAGFERVGKGPLFDGRPSHRYRYNDE